MFFKPRYKFGEITKRDGTDNRTTQNTSISQNAVLCQALYQFWSDASIQVKKRCRMPVQHCLNLFGTELIAAFFGWIDREHAAASPVIRLRHVRNGVSGSPKAFL